MSRVPVWAGLSLAFALLLLASPYRGIRHDGLLYAAQALTHVDPTALANDFFFRYGSQDQYTLFTRVLAMLVGPFGVGGPVLGFLVAGRLLSLVAIWLIAAEWPAWRRWLAVIAYAGMTHHFGGGRLFALMEPFLTARTLAEPFALFALAALLRRRLLLAGACLLLAVACHPLVALPLAIAGWFYLVSTDRRWIAAGLLVVPVVVLGLLGVQPFTRLFQVYDDAWFEVVAVSNTDVLVHTWSIGDWTMLAGNLVFLGFALRGRREGLARFARASALAVVVLLVLSWVGTDLFHDILITQLQPWRGTWVAHLAFALWMPGLVVDLWRRGGLARIAGVNTFVVAVALGDAFPTGWALLLWAVALLALEARGVTLSRTILRLLWVATAVVAAGTCAIEANGLFIQSRMHVQGTAVSHVASLPFALAILSVPAAVLLLRACGAEDARVARAARGAVVLCLVVAGWQFDQRPAFTRYEEHNAPGSNPFVALIPPGSQVYWEDMDVTPTWFVLRRPSFISAAQFSGLLFNRRTAMVGKERAPFLFALWNRQQTCLMLEGMTGPHRFEDCQTPEDLFFSVCRMRPEHADFAVTRQRYQHPAIASWRFVPEDGGPPVTYFLHDCRTAR